MKKESSAAKTQESPMKQIKLGKVVVNIGLKDSGEHVERAYIFLEKLTGKKPIKTISTLRARTFRLRKGLPIGVKVTIRNADALAFLKKVLPAVENRVKETSFDNEGNFGFGIKEHLDIPGQKYDPKIGVLGLNVNASLVRHGFRIKMRKIRKSRIGASHRISKPDAINFVKTTLGLKVV